MKKKWNLPPNWNWIPLSELISDMSGGTWGTDDDPNGPAVLRPNNIGLDGYIVFEDLRFREIPLEQLKKQRLYAGDVILTKSNSLEQVGRCAFFIDPKDGKSYVASNFLQRLRFNENRVNPKYGFWFLYSHMAREYFQSQAKGSSASLKNLTSDVISSLEFPIPIYEDQSVSLQIQNQIVVRIEALFAELFGARRLYEKIVADTDRLMDAVLAEIYPTNDEQLSEGWRLLPLSEICTINPTRPRNLANIDEAMTSFVPMAAVDDREGRITDLQARPFGEVKRGYTYFEENDVLFAKITPCMENGKAAIARGLINRFGFGSTEFHVLRPTNRILPEWIYYFVRREAFRQEAKTKFRGAVGQQRVPADFLETHLIPVPFPQNPEKSLAVQQQIVTRVQRTASEVAEAQLGNTKTGALLNQMEQSILAQAFRGEL